MEPAATVMLTFGGILFLIAVIGGGFAVKEISVPPVPRWARIVSGASGTTLIALAVVMYMSALDLDDNPPEPPSPPPETDPTATSPSPPPKPNGSDVFVPVADQTGQLRLSVPATWAHTLGNGWHATMNPYDGSEPIGPGVNASTNADEWRAGGNVPGVFLGASYDAVEHYDPVELARVWSHDGCEFQEDHPAATSDMTGHQAIWRCPDSSTFWYDVALWPDTQDLIVLVQAHVDAGDTGLVNDILGTLQVRGAEPPS